MSVVEEIHGLIKTGVEVPGKSVKWMSSDDPRCCLCESPAIADMNTKYGGGWGLLCRDHVESRGCGKIGLGYGQAILNTKAVIK